MPKVSFVESRRDFSGGLNISGPSDTMNDNELLQCVNARIELFGGIMRRPGSRKLTPDPLGDGSYLTAVTQWRSDRQVVAISSDSHLYYSNTPYTVWTQEAQQLFALSADFAAFRDAAPSAPLVLIIAGGDFVCKWTGSALTIISETNGVPLATTVRAFGNRLFMNSMTDRKTLFWSKIGVGTDFGTGGISGGGSALVDTLTGNELVQLEVCGSSLLLMTNESIARFTGTADDIQILQDSQGVSAEIGPSNDAGFSCAVAKAEQLVFLHSERGPHVASEGGVLPIGSKIISPQQTALRMALNQTSSVGWPLDPTVGVNRRRHEMWYAYAPVGGTRRDHVLVFNTKLQCWYGPFIYPFGIMCFGVYEDSIGVESIMAGCDDGHVRLLDDPDNADSFDDGATDFDCVVQFAPFGLRNGPRSTKSLEHVFLQAIGDYTYTVNARGDLGIVDEGALVT